MNKKQKVLFVCTGNSCRSQIAEGLLRDMAVDRFDVYSAGSHPSRVHPNAIAVTEEWGIDISHHTSDAIDDYLNEGIDIVITVCDHANKLCPIFPGEVQRIHWSIDDPFRSWTSDLLDNFRETRRDIKERLEKFLKETNSEK
ncbi:MAG: arsenate reductase ArsC [Fidelibacterota bacterium]|jgi:arsenate reductase